MVLLAPPLCKHAVVKQYISHLQLIGPEMQQASGFRQHLVWTTPKLLPSLLLQKYGGFKKESLYFVVILQFYFSPADGRSIWIL